ncbi:hypothetical protein F5Y04DRAFT_253481 [Hypomontagnella monticulosa]|nr:hypothetical protein F5Y04DRAFT_253481 [Hypomontagnella monticulosa]
MAISSLLTAHDAVFSTIWLTGFFVSTAMMITSLRSGQSWIYQYRTYPYDPRISVSYPLVCVSRAAKCCNTEFTRYLHAEKEESLNLERDLTWGIWGFVRPVRTLL